MKRLMDWMNRLKFTMTSMKKSSGCRVDPIRKTVFWFLLLANSQEEFLLFLFLAGYPLWKNISSYDICLSPIPEINLNWYLMSLQEELENFSQIFVVMKSAKKGNAKPLNFRLYQPKTSSTLCWLSQWIKKTFFKN